MSNATDDGRRRPDRGERSHAAGTDGRGDPRIEDRLDERLSAVERAVTESDAAVADLGDSAAAAAEREALESRVAELESRVEELEAATQAIRGYVGSIRAVNREVERRADLALARASCGGDAAAETAPRSEADRAGADPDGAGPGDAVSGDASPSEAVPGEAALDAAVPEDAAAPRGAPDRGDGGGASDPEAVESDGEADGSWRDGPLDRLRESL
ncbi:hypothetical protein ACFQMF_09020 [Halorubrum rutilum]|uniref:DUF7310 domain-containing protein n=1 Tax=Halorubrum rutilum TaxID=1364933 RepID=A0ABD6AKC8_9EURY|nr:hypothetical protein [Halorubrum rutilum]